MSARNACHDGDVYPFLAKLFSDWRGSLTYWDYFNTINKMVGALFSFVANLFILVVAIFFCCVAMPSSRSSQKHFPDLFLSQVCVLDERYGAPQETTPLRKQNGAHPFRDMRLFCFCSSNALGDRRVRGSPGCICVAGPPCWGISKDTSGIAIADDIVLEAER